MFGASIFPSDTVTQVTTGVTSAITDNIGIVIGLAVFFIGLRVAQKLLGGGLKGRVRLH